MPRQLATYGMATLTCSLSVLDLGSEEAVQCLGPQEYDVVWAAPDCRTMSAMSQQCHGRTKD
eukprot:5087189-Prymnesium_polylepis.1